MRVLINTYMNICVYVYMCVAAVAGIPVAQKWAEGVRKSQERVRVDSNLCGGDCI